MSTEHRSDLAFSGSARGAGVGGMAAMATGARVGSGMAAAATGARSGSGMAAAASGGRAGSARVDTPSGHRVTAAVPVSPVVTYGGVALGLLVAAGAGFAATAWGASARTVASLAALLGGGVAAAATVSAGAR